MGSHSCHMKRLPLLVYKDGEFFTFISQSFTMFHYIPPKPAVRTSKRLTRKCVHPSGGLKQSRDSTLGPPGCCPLLTHALSLSPPAVATSRPDQAAQCSSWRSTSDARVPSRVPWAQRQGSTYGASLERWIEQFRLAIDSSTSWI